MNVAAAPKTTSWQTIIHNGAPSSHVINGVITIATIAIRFTLRSILPSRCQFLISGQNILIPVSTLAVQHTRAGNNNRFFGALQKCANTTETPYLQIITSRISIKFTSPGARDSVVKPVSERPQKACYYAA